MIPVIKNGKKKAQPCYPFSSFISFPENVGGLEKYPLLLFLHGAGERGTDVELMALHGPLKHAQNGKEFPFIIAAPQCPADNYWTAYIESLNTYLDNLIEEYPIDPDRIYLTGISMGGCGTWQWALANPERFAAIAPVCGIGIPWYAERLKNMPVWAFHGEQDGCIPCHHSVEMVNAIQAVGGNARLTTYPEIGHNAWDPAYENEELYRWLLSQKKQGE